MLEDKEVYGFRCQHCGKAAFYFKELPDFKDAIRSANCYCKEDSEQPMTHTKIVCQFCKVDLYGFTLPRHHVVKFSKETGEEITNIEERN